MKPISYWVMQYLLAASSLTGVLLAFDVGQGNKLADAWPSCLAWAAVASAIFIGSRYRRMRKGADCALCVGDEPK